MTIEEKAKAYDEAKARMSRAFNSNRCTIGFMNEIFPELAESKDERIRKELIDIVKKSPITFAFEDKGKVLAWLEKQGEQKQYDIDVLEKHITKDSISELAHTVIVRNGWEIVDAKEQNPVWSEEDDYNLQCMIAKVASDIQKGNVGRNQELIDWLKSLKGRVQPKQEWSGEDEEMCQETIDWFEKKCFPYALENDNPARKSIKWLKSLKDRYTWKPSEEQMLVLELASKYERVFISKQIDILIDLKNQLKKLKGE